MAWAEQRQQNAEPASPGHGQAWATKRIEEGDQTCAANQALHGEAANLMEKIKANATYNPPVADPLDPVTFVKKIDVPTFMACQWEDEQTGGHCADLAQHFTGTSRKWFTFTNGAHVDSLDPYTFDRLYDFLELYVAHQAPIVNAAVIHAAAPVIYDEAMGLPKTDLVTLPSDPIQEKLTYESALAAFEALPDDQGPVRQRRRHLAARHHDAPAIRTRASKTRSRASRSPARRPQTWYLGPDGTLTEQQPADGRRRLLHLRRERHAADRLRREHRLGRSVGQRVAVGMELGAAAGGLRGVLRVGAAHDQHDRDRRRRRPPVGQVLHPERRLPGDRQRGASRRQRDLRAERLAAGQRAQARDQREEHVQAEADACCSRSRRSLASDEEPMPANEFVPVTIPLYFEGHAYRAGSRIRVTIAAPNGTQPIWSFSQTEPAGDTATESIAFSPSMPSSLTLPIVPGSQRADGAARLPEPAQRALPALPGVRQRRLLTPARSL